MFLNVVEGSGQKTYAVEVLLFSSANTRFWQTMGELLERFFLLYTPINSIIILCDIQHIDLITINLQIRRSIKMSRKYFTTAVLKAEGVRFDYYLLSENLLDCNGKMCTTYGVEIRQNPLNAFSRCSYKVCSLPDISCDKGKILDFLRELADSFTDPSGLIDLAEEIV